MRQMLRRGRQRLARVALMAAAVVSFLGSQAPAATSSDERAAADTYLRHIYSIYFGVRACSQLSAELKDRAYQSSISDDEARAVMRKVENAATEAGIATDAVWASTAPRALVTASALKRSSQRLALCQRMGDIFRDDEANLQSLLGHLGSRQMIIPKDF
jgi:hypothetical protein